MHWCGCIHKPTILTLYIERAIRLSSIALRLAGYIIHEAAVWSDVRRRWYFLPRRASMEGYNDKEDERRATNLLFSADESFQDVTVTKLLRCRNPQLPAPT